MSFLPSQLGRAWEKPARHPAAGEEILLPRSFCSAAALAVLAGQVHIHLFPSRASTSVRHLPRKGVGAAFALSHKVSMISNQLSPSLLTKQSIHCLERPLLEFFHSLIHYNPCCLYPFFFSPLRIQSVHERGRKFLMAAGKTEFTLISHSKIMRAGVFKVPSYN